MRKIIGFITLLFFVALASVSAQENFSVSIDVGESSNYSSGIYNDGNGMLVINSRHFCPPQGLTSCSGYISYHYEEGFLHDTMFSEYPNGLNATGKTNICKLGDNFLLAANYRIDGDLVGLRMYNFDAIGQSEWLFDLLEPSICMVDCYFRSIVCDTVENSIFVMGQMTSEEERRHPFIIKLDSTGEKQWTSIMERHWGSGNVVDARMTPGGDILIVSRDGNAIHMIARVTKVSPDGEVLWDKHYDTGRVGAGQPWIAVLDDDNYVLRWAGDLGTFQIYDRFAPLFMGLEGSSGEVLWQTPQIKTREIVNVTRINPTLNGEIIGTGDATLVFVEEWEHHQGDGGFLMRMSATGEMLWNRRYLDLSNDAVGTMGFLDVTELPDGSLFAVGSRFDTVGLGFHNVNAWVVRLDENGYCNDPEACEHLIIIDVPTSVEDLEEEPVSGDLHLFPNPATHDVTVEGLSGGVGLLDVYSSTAELVYSRRVDGVQTTLQVSDWPAGMYIVMYRTADGNEVKRGRLIVK